MPKAPAFQFYPRDFLTDEKVALMSNTETGIYIRLLCFCWLEGTLPLETVALARMVRMPMKQFTKLWENSVVKTCFQVDADGRLHHGRLDKEREKQDAFKRRQSDAAASRWHPSGNATALPVASESHSPRECRVKTVEADIQTPEEKNGEIAAQFIERYQALYREHRNGAKLYVRPNLDWTRVCDLLAVWDVARLEKLAVILLTTDDEWVARTDRSIGIFAARASWCDDMLRKWEVKQGIAV